MISVREKIVERLLDLPEPTLREVLNFVEFLTWKSDNHGQGLRAHEDDPFLAVIGTLSGTGKSLTNEEIDLELYGPITVREEPNEA